MRDFELSEPGRLYAIGDPARIEIYRSLRIGYTDEGYWPVSEYIWSHGLVLNVSTVHQDDDMAGGTAEYSVYTRPGAPAESPVGVSFRMGALMCGMTLGEFLALMVEEGLVLEHPDGGYIASPHPSIVDRYPGNSGW